MKTTLGPVSMVAPRLLPSEQAIRLQKDLLRQYG
jgi:hypothetical protein